MSKRTRILSLIISLIIICTFSFLNVFAIDEDTSKLDGDTTTKVELITISGTRKGLSIEVGDSVTLEVPEGLTNPVFESSNPNILSVNKTTGVITAKSTGTAVITASNSTYYQLYEYTVKPKTTTKTTTTTTTTNEKVTNKKLTVVGTLTISLEKGKSTNLSHAGLTGKISYRSGDNGIARVDSNGKVTAVKVGSTYVQAYDDTRVLNYQINVTESEKETVTVEETTTKANESETVAIEDVVGIDDETTSPEITSDTIEQTSDNSALKTKILIITAVVILIIIIASILIYRFVSARNMDDYPVDFYPENEYGDNPEAVEDEDMEMSEYNFTEKFEDDNEDVTLPEDGDDSFINDDPEGSDDEFLL